MERITRQNLQAKCDLLNELLGLPKEPYRQEHGRHVAQIGNIHLDKNMQGWQVVQMHNESAAVSCPLGNWRLTAFECLMALQGAIAGVELANKALSTPHP